MCSDIIVHQADKVPVGKDQEQNLEMARKFAKRFNHMYGVEYFTLPEPYNFGEELIKVPGLDGTGKMGKSEGNGIYLADDPEVIRKKVMRAVSDAGPQKPNSPMSEPVANLFYLLELLSAPDTVKHFRDSKSNWPKTSSPLPLPSGSESMTSTLIPIICARWLRWGRRKPGKALPRPYARYARSWVTNHSKK